MYNPAKYTIIRTWQKPSCHFNYFNYLSSNFHSHVIWSTLYIKYAIITAQAILQLRQIARPIGEIIEL